MKAPRFFDTFLSATGLAYKTRGLGALVPWWFALTCGTPIVGNSLIANYPEGLTNLMNDVGKLFPVYGAMLVVGGFCCAAPVNAMTQVFNLTQDPLFADYLKEQKVFDKFIFWPQLTLGIQIIYIVLVIIAITHLVVFHNKISILLLWICSGALAYAISKIWSLLDLVRQLAWYRQDYLFTRHKMELEAQDDVSHS